jgi:hypothetical protein
MSENEKLKLSQNYTMGNVGAGARVAQGSHISWVEGISGLQDGQLLARKFTELLERIELDDSLDQDDRLVAQEKTKAIADALSNVLEEPAKLRLALKDAKSWFGVTATWAGKAIGDILSSDAAQKTLSTVTEAATKAAINQFGS